tara:strand:+ start:402 stop:1859 length:1458 start_codon:yes stop_codon:yes gene_type:complete
MHLTKSRYLSGLHCSKKLWLNSNKYNLSNFSESFNASIGIEVGIGATTIYSKGSMVQASYKEHESAVLETLAFINSSETEAIFEAAFEFDDIRIRVDVFERLGKNEWGIREVKSSKSIKKIYYKDIAIQYYVLKGLGYNIASAKLMHTNSNYILNGKKINWDDFFSTVEYLPDIEDSMNETVIELTYLKEVQNYSNEPAVYPYKSFCNGCEFWDYCTKDKPIDWIEYLPRLSERKRDKLKKNKIQSISDIPEKFILTDLQSKVVKSSKTGNIMFGDNFSSEIMEYQPPVYFFDFETLGCAIPIFNGLKPFERVPFQWSLHHLSENREINHWEYLADEKIDFRRVMIEKFINIVISDNDKIIVYNESFEKSVLKDMIVLYPDLKVKINKIIDRIIDLMAFIKKNLYHPKFNGSFSLKKVLPALLPNEEQYREGGVSDGNEAQKQFYNIISDKYDQNEKNEVIKNLIAYCKKDTYSLLLILQKLLEK